jgi:phospholipase/carboxylesterase
MALECALSRNPGPAMTDLLPAVEIESVGAAKASMIWLHGLGADGYDLESVVPALNLPAKLGIRFVLPHAPAIPVTINGGATMPAWYDIMQLGEERQFNRAQLVLSAQQVHALIDREIARGVPSNKIVLAGFSQGGAVCYHAGLSYSKPLAGIAGLSTYFPTHDSVVPNPVQKGMAILICHGTLDQVVPIAMGRNSRRNLEMLGFVPEFRTYSMMHALCEDEIRDIAGFVMRCLGPETM